MNSKIAVFQSKQIASSIPLTKRGEPSAAPPVPHSAFAESAITPNLQYDNCGMGWMKGYSVVRFHDYLNSLPWDDNSKNHNKAYKSFLRAAFLGVDTQAAIDAVSEKIKVVGGIVDPRDLARQLQRAYEFGRNGGVGNLRLPKCNKIELFSETRLRDFAAKVDLAAPAEWLRLNSPVNPASVTPAGFLCHIFNPGEHIVVMTNQEGRGQSLFAVAGGNFQPLPPGSPEGVYFLVQPVDGAKHWNPRENKYSRRSEEAVTAWRHLVLETDVADLDDWIKLLVQLPLRIVAIYSSGGRSVHALVRVDAQSKVEWDILKRQIAEVLVPLGADRGALSAVRLSRLPQCYRGGRLQELLYLNPNATGRPIYGVDGGSL